MSLHYRCLPLDLTDAQINDYLTLHKTGQLGREQPSEGYFKHTVFGLRYMFKTYDIAGRQVGMPVMKRTKGLRDIMNRHEVMQLLRSARLSKHKIAFALAYGSGLRVNELVHIKRVDIDIIRKTVHVRNGKGGYDRYVPISEDFIRGFSKYVDDHSIYGYVFPGQTYGKPISISAMQHALKTTRIRAGIMKPISMHNIRHTYAVHFLEDTGDLLRLKQNLGHRDIKNTMEYLKYVEDMPRSQSYSPLTKVFELARMNKES